ncbi:MAG: hypothetical protein ACYCYE_17370 [Clostridia bacterium]
MNYYGKYSDWQENTVYDNLYSECKDTKKSVNTSNDTSSIAAGLKGKRLTAKHVTDKPTDTKKLL